MTTEDDAADAALAADAAARKEQRAAQERGRRWLVGAAVAAVIAGGYVIVRDPGSPVVGAVGGLAALAVVGLLASDYFWTPRPGDEIRAPNRYVRIAAGLLAIGSALAWILDSLFN
jgi:hypothetical protein